MKKVLTVHSSARDAKLPHALLPQSLPRAIYRIRSRHSCQQLLSQLPLHRRSERLAAPLLVTLRLSEAPSPQVPPSPKFEAGS